MRYNYGVRMNCAKCDVSLTPGAGELTTVAVVISSHMTTAIDAMPARICKQCVENKLTMTVTLTRVDNAANFTLGAVEIGP